MAFENDWAFLREALPELQNYILSNDVYRPLGQPARMPGSVQIPQLTIGNLLLSQARLAGRYSPEERTAELVEVDRRIEAERSAWRSNWAKKAGREYTSRLNLWNQYLRELRSDPRAHASAYATEVRHRTILRMLAAEILGEIANSEVEQLTLLDKILEGLTQPGPFVWETGVERAFPNDGFWYLYRTVRK